VILNSHHPGAAIPVSVKHFPRLQIAQWIFDSIKHFGTGILISTACTHLIPTAFNGLQDVKFFEKYEAAPGAILMFGLLLIFLVDICMHPSNVPFNYESQEDKSVTVPLTSSNTGNSSSSTDSHLHQRSEFPNTRQNPDLGVFFLELSILSHSIFIGLSISLTTVSLWPLVIAFTFHQMFEGLALGVRIAKLLPPPHSHWRARAVPWCLVCAFALTAPIGQAIGLGVHATMIGEVGTVVGAVMNGLSAGMLMYTALVDLVAVDFFAQTNLPGGLKKIPSVMLLILGCKYSKRTDLNLPICDG
jgi:zinc transporter 1/2/3